MVTHGESPWWGNNACCWRKVKVACFEEDYIKCVKQIIITKLVIVSCHWVLLVAYSGKHIFNVVCNDLVVRSYRGQQILIRSVLNFHEKVHHYNYEQKWPTDTINDKWFLLKWYLALRSYSHLHGYYSGHDRHVAYTFRWVEWLSTHTHDIHFNTINWCMWTLFWS